MSSQLKIKIKFRLWINLCGLCLWRKCKHTQYKFGYHKYIICSTNKRCEFLKFISNFGIFKNFCYCFSTFLLTYFCIELSLIHFCNLMCCGAKFKINGKNVYVWHVKRGPRCLGAGFIPISLSYDYVTYSLKPFLPTVPFVTCHTLQ